jgi:hypothetical protein
MNSWACQDRVTARGSKIGVGASIWTSTTTAAVTATGAAECITMQSGQWSASFSTGWMCATWTTASSANRTRHKTDIAGQAPCLARRSLRKCVCNPVKQTTPALRIHKIRCDSFAEGYKCLQYSTQAASQRWHASLV